MKACASLQNIRDSPGGIPGQIGIIMSLPAQIKSKYYHLTGIGGVGMSALAQLLLATGCRVTGSDRYYDEGRDLDVFKKLRLLGIDLLPQDGGAVKDGLAAVVVSTAIEKNNPDLIAAWLKGIPIVHRAALLAELALDKRCIAVTGTAGKTTVTGMIGWTLEQLGLDPTVVNGGAVINWVTERCPGNFRFGHSDIWVLELDESDRSLLNFHPQWAVITNISKDHFELDEVRELFTLFSAQVRMGIVGCHPVSGAGERLDDLCPSLTENEIVFKYRGIEFRLALLGRHNAENALHCVMLCERLGLDLNAVSLALRNFKGIERRLEVVGRTKGITVIDDYAHNPAKIAAALQTVKSFARRIIAVWRPHGYGPLALMRGEFTDIFLKQMRPGDQLIIMPVYYAGGTAEKKVTSRMLAEDLRTKGVMVNYVEDYPALRSGLLALVADFDAIVFMGARDPDLSVFARRFIFELDNLIMDRMPRSGGVAQENKPADQAQRNGNQIHHE